MNNIVCVIVVPSDDPCRSDAVGDGECACAGGVKRSNGPIRSAEKSVIEIVPINVESRDCPVRADGVRDGPLVQSRARLGSVEGNEPGTFGVLIVLRGKPLESLAPLLRSS